MVLSPLYFSWSPWDQGHPCMCLKRCRSWFRNHPQRKLGKEEICPERPVFFEDPRSIQAGKKPLLCKFWGLKLFCTKKVGLYFGFQCFSRKGTGRVHQWASQATLAELVSGWIGWERYSPQILDYRWWFQRFSTNKSSLFGEDKEHIFQSVLILPSGGISRHCWHWVEAGVGRCGDTIL